MNKNVWFLEIKSPFWKEKEINAIDTKVVWSYDGAQIIISYDYKEYNYLTQNHMKYPNSPYPWYQNDGFSNSIIYIEKNPYDKRFLLTLGRDNLVICWSLKTKKPLCKIEIDILPCSQVREPHQRGDRLLLS